MSFGGKHEWARDAFRISTDRAEIDLACVVEFLSEHSYWAPGIPTEVVEKSLDHSVVFGLYREGGRQIGFARVVSDLATFAYLADVFVLDPYRGRGLSKWLVECVLSHPELQGLRRWMLGTRDAHSLYQRYGFTPLPDPGRFMQIHAPGVYLREPPSASNR